MSSSDHDKSFASRVEMLIKVSGSVTKLSEDAAVSRGSIGKWRNSQADPSRSNIISLAKATNVNAYWLLTGEGLMRGREVVMVDENHTYPTVARYNVAASAGHGFFIEKAEILDHVPFTPEFLEKKMQRKTTKGLILIDAGGDSMEPTIKDGDMIMVDTYKKMLTSAVYAFTYNGELFVKRLHHRPDSLEAHSDNKEYLPFIMHKDEMDAVNILGRVVWVGHMI